MKTELLTPLCLSLLLLGSCVPPQEPVGPPDPIGDEVLSFITALGVPGCAEGHLYRLREDVQYQCFTTEGVFSWENRGTLTMQGQMDLDAALDTADISDTTPGDGWACNSSEIGSAITTLWVGSESVSYSAGCPFQGVKTLDELATTLLGDISDCIELDMLESVEDGCRPY